MKKLLMIAAVFAFSFAITASVAFANDRHHRGHDDSGIEVNNSNNAQITNNVSTEAETGENSIRGEGRIRTGDAYADAIVTTRANSNETSIDCNCVPRKGEMEINNSNTAQVVNNVETESETGDNNISGYSRHHHGLQLLSINGNGGHGRRGGGGSISTGNATSYADVVTVVNSNVTNLGSGE